MDPQTLRSRLEGVIGFPITPFRSDYSLDLDGYRANLKRMMAHSFSAIVAAGGTGELYSLTQEEYRLIVQATVEESAGRIPIIAGVGFNWPLATSMAKQAQSLGADGILGFPPYYPRADFEGLHAYYKVIGEASSLGLLIYSRDWANFTPTQVERLAEIPSLIAWKDGQGDIRRYQMIRDRLGDRLYWIGGAGDDLVPGYYSMGIRTYTSSISNVAPRLSLRLHELASQGDYTTLADLMKRFVTPLYELRTKRKGFEVSAMKAMMDEQGQVGGLSRPPLVEVSSSERDVLKRMLEDWREYL